MKHKNMILAVAAGLLTLTLLFIWLFWGSKTPEPTDTKGKDTGSTVKATVYNTELNREENGRKKWKLKVGEAIQSSNDVISAKNLKGTVYLSNGDEMYVTADAGKISDKNNQFELSGKVNARLKKGGFMKADKVEWNEAKDILIATGSVKVVKDDMLARAEKIITSSELKHFKLIDKAHVERGGHYEEK